MTTVSFYVKAGVETGYGHIVRCLALADELAHRGTVCAFFTNQAGAERLWQTSHTLIEYSDLILDTKLFDVWIIDLEGGCPPELANRFRPLCKTLVILNGVGYPDGDPGRLLADLVFYQGVTDRPASLDWSDFSGRWFVGPEWLILRDEFRRLATMKKSLHEAGRHSVNVVISGGGSDPKSIARKVEIALMTKGLNLRVIVGPANEESYASCTLKNPSSMAETLAWADLAIVSYGMTAFECLALGLPTIALSVSSDHAASAELVEQQSGGTLINLGEVESVTSEMIQAAVSSALAQLPVLSKRAVDFVDGLGAGRVAEMILK